MTPPFNKEQDADYFYAVKYKDSTWITILENRLWLAKDILEGGGSVFVRCDYNGNMYTRLLLSRIFGTNNLRNELIVKRGKIQFGESNKYTVATDSLFLCSKTDNYYFEKFRRPRYSHEPKGSNMILRGERFPRERAFMDASNCLHVLLPPPDTHFKFIQTTIDDMTKRGLITLNTSKKGLNSGFTELINGRWEKTDLVPAYRFDVNKALDSNWTDISGYSQDWGFPTENSEKLLHRAIKTSSVDSEIVLDFFLGSGTTVAVAHKLNRKWIGVEMGQHFYGIVLTRMKEVLAGKGNHEPCGISKEIKWQGGGFFKYYELEQYEDTLRKVKYEDSDLFDSISPDPYNRYIFLRDLKMLEALEVDYENNKVGVDLQKLYPNIDIPETLSNLLGKYIKKIKPNEVEFENGEKIDLNNLDYKLIKPLIWW